MTRCLAFALAILLFALSACGGGHSALTPSPGADHAAPADPLSAGLPALDKLPVPTRSVSLSGPGWYSIPLAEMEGFSGAALNADAIDIAGAPPLAYTLYGVCRFDGDNGPTSVKATVAAVTGDYYIGFSDYKYQRWDFAGPFNASAEASLPQMDRHTSVNDFVSPMGVSYIVIGVKPGDALTLTKLELGVHGGAKGPRPPEDVYIQQYSEGPHYRIDWDNSPDSTAPDFAGYYIEKAPLLEGGFTPLNTTPVKPDYWFDPTDCVSGLYYRYRICAVDASGNRSAWSENHTDSLTGDTDHGLIARMRVPHGLLYGPAQVDFDFSESQPPDTGPITEYKVTIPSGQEFTSTDSPVVSATLQPGCYGIRGTVTTQDFNADYTISKFVLYPRWQEQPVVVRRAASPADPALSRLQYLRGCTLSNGDVVLIGYDPGCASLAVWQGPPAGTPRLTLLPAEGVISISEPIMTTAHDGYAYFLASSGQFLYEVIIGPETPRLSQKQPNAIGGYVNDIVGYTRGDIVFGLACVTTFDETSTLIYKVAFNDYNSWNIINGSAGIKMMAACDDPSKDTVYIAYSTSTEIISMEYHDSGFTFGNGQQLADHPADAVDIELDPASGRPVVAYSYSGQHYYRSLDETGMWSPEQAIDPAVTCHAPLDIAFIDGVLYAYFATTPSGVSAVYKLDAGAWIRIGEVSFSGDDGYQTALLPLSGDPGVLACDVDSMGNTYLIHLAQDATDSVLWSIPGTDGQGFELHASSYSDGLHAVWRSELTDRLRHYLSSDGGATWQDADPGESLPLGAHGVDMSPGYLSYEDGVNSYLNQWDPDTKSFALVASIPNSGHERPFMDSNDPENSTIWEAYNGADSTLTFFITGSLGTVPWSDTRIFDGTCSKFPFTGMNDDILSLVTYRDAADSSYTYKLGLISCNELKLSPVSVINNTDAAFSPAVLGRTLAQTYYLDSNYWTMSSGFHKYDVAFFSAYSKSNLPLRYELMQDDSPLIAEMPLPNSDCADPRRTVSSAVAWGDTAVVLVASLDGSQTLFQWSNFGEWQDIPLPKGLTRAFQPELVVGNDGRWHILYKDWLTDDLMCWSTL